MNHLLNILFFLIFHCTVNLSFAQNDTFDEELMLKPLPNGYVYAYFQFTTLWKVQNNADICKCNVFFKILLPSQ